MNSRAALVGALLLSVSTLAAQTGRVRIRVTDRNGAAIVTSRASLLGAFDTPMRTEAANDAGEIVLTDMAPGYSRFEVAAPFFQSLQLAAAIRNGDEQKIEVTLEVALIEQGGPHVETMQMPNSDKLDLIPELSPSPPQPKPSKRHWWQIFR